MKLGLISDVHGDPAALELAWGHLTALGADSIVCAGDLVGYGPNPDVAVAFLAERNVPCVRGNHDRWAISRGLGAGDDFGGGTPSRETWLYLRDLPAHRVFELDGRVVVLVHATPHSDMEFIAPSTHPPSVLDGYLGQLRADILIGGHSHRPMQYRGSGGLVVNPGSVISERVVETSRTFAVVELSSLGVTFYDVATGREVDIPPWNESESPSEL